MRDRGQKGVLFLSAAVASLLGAALAASALRLVQIPGGSGPALTGPGLPGQFAIADLDGDRTPDLAEIEIENERSARSHYSVQVQLSAGAPSAIRLNAPLGGIRLAARDVNGDDAMDLIVSSIFDAHIVAVLLNDGHGRFSFGRTDEYALTGESEIFLNQREQAPADRLTLAPTRPTFDGLCIVSTAACSASSSGSGPGQEASASTTLADDLTRGRAPPPLVILA